MARISAIDREIALWIREDLSPEAQSAALAAEARKGLAQAEAVNRNVLGRTPAHQTIVDGVSGAPETQVRPDGRIVYLFELGVEALEWIGEQLVLHSPVFRGAYVKAHRLFADNVEIDDYRTAPVAEQYVFVNMQPYARKLEGTAGKPPASAQAPDGVYQVVAAMAQQRFGNVAAIKFTYRSVNGGAIGEWAATDSAIAGSGSRYALAHGKKRRERLAGDVRADRRREWLTRQPAISIELR